MRKKREGFIRKLTSGHIDWAAIFGRYVWDPETTPYFTPVQRLTQRQANSEVRIYAVIIGIAAIVMCVAYLGGVLPSSDPFSVALYCLIASLGALVLAVTRVEPAAWVACSFPVLGIVRLAMGPIHPNHDLIDRVLLISVCAIFAAYSWRLIRITRHDPLPNRSSTK